MAAVRDRRRAVQLAVVAGARPPSEEIKKSVCSALFYQRGCYAKSKTARTEMPLRECRALLSTVYEIDPPMEITLEEETKHGK